MDVNLAVLTVAAKVARLVASTVAWLVVDLVENSAFSTAVLTDFLKAVQ